MVGQQKPFQFGKKKKNGMMGQGANPMGMPMMGQGANPMGQGNAFTNAFGQDGGATGGNPGTVLNPLGGGGFDGGGEGGQQSITGNIGTPDKGWGQQGWGQQGAGDMGMGGMGMPDMGGMGMPGSGGIDMGGGMPGMPQGGGSGGIWDIRTKDAPPGSPGAQTVNLQQPTGGAFDLLQPGGTPLGGGYQPQEPRTGQRGAPSGINPNLNEMEKGPDGKWRAKTGGGQQQGSWGDVRPGSLGSDPNLKTWNYPQGAGVGGPGMGGMGGGMPGAGGMGGPGMGGPGMGGPGMGGGLPGSGGIDMGGMGGPGMGDPSGGMGGGMGGPGMGGMGGLFDPQGTAPPTGWAEGIGGPGGAAQQGFLQPGQGPGQQISLPGAPGQAGDGVSGAEMPTGGPEGGPGGFVEPEVVTSPTGPPGADVDKDRDYYVRKHMGAGLSEAEANAKYDQMKADMASGRKAAPPVEEKKREEEKERRKKAAEERREKYDPKKHSLGWKIWDSDKQAFVESSKTKAIREGIARKKDWEERGSIGVPDRRGHQPQLPPWRIAWLKSKGLPIPYWQESEVKKRAQKAKEIREAGEKRAAERAKYRYSPHVKPPDSTGGPDESRTDFGTLGQGGETGLAGTLSDEPIMGAQRVGEPGAAAAGAEPVGAVAAAPVSAAAGAAPAAAAAAGPDLSAGVPSKNWINKKEVDSAIPNDRDAEKLRQWLNQNKKADPKFIGTEHQKKIDLLAAYDRNRGSSTGGAFKPEIEQLFEGQPKEKWKQIIEGIPGLGPMDKAQLMNALFNQKHAQAIRGEAPKEWLNYKKNITGSGTDYERWKPVPFRHRGAAEQAEERVLGDGQPEGEQQAPVQGGDPSTSVTQLTPGLGGEEITMGTETIPGGSTASGAASGVAETLPAGSDLTQTGHTTRGRERIEFFKDASGNRYEKQSDGSFKLVITKAELDARSQGDDPSGTVITESAPDWPGVDTTGTQPKTARDDVPFDAEPGAADDEPFNAGEWGGVYRDGKGLMENSKTGETMDPVKWQEKKDAAAAAVKEAHTGEFNRDEWKRTGKKDPDTKQDILENEITGETKLAGEVGELDQQDKRAKLDAEIRGRTWTGLGQIPEGAIIENGQVRIQTGDGTFKYLFQKIPGTLGPFDPRSTPETWAKEKPLYEQRERDQWMKQFTDQWASDTGTNWGDFESGTIDTEYDTEYDTGDDEDGADEPPYEEGDTGEPGEGMWPVETLIRQQDVMAPIYSGDFTQRMTNIGLAGKRKSLPHETWKGMGRGMSVGPDVVHQFGLPGLATSGAERSYLQGQIPFMSDLANIQRRTEMAKLRSGEALSWADLLKRQWTTNQMKNLAYQRINQQDRSSQLGSMTDIFGQLLS